MPLQTAATPRNPRTEERNAERAAADQAIKAARQVLHRDSWTAPGHCLGPESTSNVATPGPGAYNLRREPSAQVIEAPRRTNPIGVGAIPFRSRISRLAVFDDTVCGGLILDSSEHPEPGKYSPPLAFYQVPAKSLQEPHANLVVPNPEPPAIPLNRDPKKARCTGQPEDMSAPGDYNQKVFLGLSGIAADFHASKGERELYPPQCSIENRINLQSPGPGSYDTDLVMVKGTTQAFRSSSPQIGFQQSSATPGPGAYRAEGPALPAPGEAASSSLPGMGTTTVRHLHRPGLVPGPGQYDNPSTAFMGGQLRARINGDALGKKFLGVHTPKHQTMLKEMHAAPPGNFGTTESRDCLSTKKSPSPDPGSYDRHDAMDQSISSGLKEQARLGKGGAFGASKTADRFADFLGTRSKAGPSPDEYQRGSSSTSPLRANTTGVGFRSASPQRASSEDILQSPGPGDYEENRGIIGPVVSSGTSSPPKKFRQGKTDHLSFGSCSTRFGSMPGLFGARQSSPGPGEYNPQKSQLRVSGMSKSTSQRTLAEAAAEGGGKKMETPAPGAYNTTGTLFRKISFRTKAEAGTFGRAGAPLGADAPAFLDATAKPSRPQSGAKDPESMPVGGGAGGGSNAMRFRLGPEKPS